MNEVISLSDIAHWVSKKFEADRCAPMLTIQIDSGRRMMQISTATLVSGSKVPYVYVVEERDPKTFMSGLFIDFIFLEQACPSLEKLLELAEDPTAQRMSISRVTTWTQVSFLETKVAAALWAHLVMPTASP